MTHTQGPWTYEQIGVTDAGPNHDDVFDIGPCDREGAMRKRIATVVGDDARLIAAAPDLLSVAQAFLEWHADHFEDFDSETNKQLLCLANDAQSAIAKATNA